MQFILIFFKIHYCFYWLLLSYLVFVFGYVVSIQIKGAKKSFIYQVTWKAFYYQFFKTFLSSWYLHKFSIPKHRYFIYIFSVLFLFFHRKNPFMYQVTWKGFDAKNFLFFKFLSIYIISAEIRAMFLYKIQFKINPCTAYIIHCFNLLFNTLCTPFDFF